jgi:hypothetical protein
MGSGTNDFRPPDILEFAMRVRFIHKMPMVQNLGDMLCTPKHYFRLAWGIGKSLKPGRDVKEQIESLPYAQWGLRDRDRAKHESNFLPCVSCMHEMLDAPIEREQTLFFLNADIRETPQTLWKELRTMAEARSFNLLMNNCLEAQFANALRFSSKVVTNSFHGAYWSLLSGRSVICLGYSSKFVSLFHSFDFPKDTLIAYDRSVEQDLIEKIRKALSDEHYVHLSDATRFRNEFRERNIRFAETMVKNKLIEDFSVKSAHLSTARKRYIVNRISAYWQYVRRGRRRRK